MSEEKYKSNYSGSQIDEAIGNALNFSPDSVNRKMNRTDNVDDSNTNITIPMARAIYAGTELMEPGTSSLVSGAIYICYE